MIRAGLVAKERKETEDHPTLVQKVSKDLLGEKETLVKRENRERLVQEELQEKMVHRDLLVHKEMKVLLEKGGQQEILVILENQA